MRLTADGKFHLCLLNDDELDVRKTLRSNSSDVIADVARILKRAVELKPTGHHLLEGRSTQDRSMYQMADRTRKLWGLISGTQEKVGRESSPRNRIDEKDGDHTTMSHRVAC